jgi:hypothetical protein
MSQKIGLYHDSIRYGQVELDSLFVMEPEFCLSDE